MVIGLGLVGQLVVQLLVASGVKVVGWDVVPERAGWPRRRRFPMREPREAEELAAVENALAKASGGLGADQVFLVASGSSKGPWSWPHVCPRPSDGGRHRQVQTRPALERLLRKGAGRTLLTVLRPWTL